MTDNWEKNPPDMELRIRSCRKMPRTSHRKRIHITHRLLELPEVYTKHVSSFLLQRCLTIMFPIKKSHYLLHTSYYPVLYSFPMSHVFMPPQKCERLRVSTNYKMKTQRFQKDLYSLHNHFQPFILEHS